VSRVQFEVLGNARNAAVSAVEVWSATAGTAAFLPKGLNCTGVSRRG